MKNRKGFTLIELLAVIVILGVIISILVPRVSQYINNSRKGSFVTTAQTFLDSVRHDATEQDFVLPVNKNDVTIVTLDKASLQKSKQKSPYGGKFMFGNSYVAIINVGTGTNTDFRYFVSLQDSKNYAIPLTLEEELDDEKVVSNAKNKMEVTIQSLCGDLEGTTVTLANISGLEKYQPVDENGIKQTWNASIYSTESCGKANNE